MPKARLYFDGDNTGIEKNARIYSLTQDVEGKLDSIPNVIDNTSSTSTTDALSANMGRDLQEQINNLASRGRFLSTWDCTTGLPTTQPQTSPYVYRAGDYYIVSATGTTNYRPHGSEYTTGVASTTVETLTVEANDLYIYDGVQWTLQGTGHGTSVAWGTIVGNIADQADLQTALFEKADKVNVLEKNNTTSYTPTADYHPATKKYTDDNDTFIGATAPTNNVIEGRLWYDTTADVLKVWNGSAWVPTGKTYTAGSHINISNADVISTVGLQEELTAGDNITIGDECTAESDMKGPAPSGFHVPSKDEWVALCGIFTSTFGMPANGAFLQTYLKIPFAGSRSLWDTDVKSQGTAGFYWSSTPSGSLNAKYLYCDSSSLYPQGGTNFGNGNSVRCFKNSPTVPTSSWTTLYDGSSVATGAGVFWDSANGLISVSGDGTTWYTIMDKNLGATSTDITNINSYGYYYQWGNNYGFANTGTLTTSNTQVDTTNYGPGNYYSDPTFITGNYNWSSVNNGNLWGGVSQSTHQECVHNVISAIDTTYTAGTGINIDSNNEISVDASVVATQTDLQNGLDEKQDLLTAGENITIEDECTTESDMKGPCPSGFHIPTKAQLWAVNDIMTGLSFGGNGDARRIYLHMPFTGARSNLTTNIDSQGSRGQYWMSNNTGSSVGDSCFRLRLYSYAVYPSDKDVRARANAIRAFKNTPVAPDNTWTTIYDGSSVAAGAGIFHNATEGLISLSSNGTNWVTIADKNVGATTIYNDGDTLTQDNMGNFYQRGNNYGFPTVGTISNTSSTQVDASTYGPGNYYNSSTFIIGNNDWSSVRNDNLWGGVSQGTFQDCIYNVISATDTTYVASDFDIKDLTDSTGLRTTWSGKQDALTAGSHIDITSNVVSTTGLQEELVAGDNITIGDECTTESDMKGPCSSGFHIGTSAEWATLKNTWVGLGQDGAAGDVFAAKFKIPFGNYRWAGTNANTSNQGTNGMYWTSTPSSGYSAYFIVMRSGYFSTTFSYARTYGFSVRPFKNTPVAPDSTWTTILDGSSVATGAGIFYNATEGLISASSNGTTWTTIADKNVGATVAWNEGDALSADNCGGLFQWGNNYMFPFSGTVSGTATLVDTTGYGPGNYYYSDLFNTTYQDWASPNNDNLRGGVSQGTFQDCIHNVISATDRAAYFKTQAEYDALPSSKNSDGSLYIIVDNHNEPVTITFTSSPEGRGTFSVNSITARQGDTITINNNVLTIGSQTITATPSSPEYGFKDWSCSGAPLPAIVLDNMDIKATFISEQ